MPQIETTRLLLRHFTLDDLPAFAVIRANAEVMQHISTRRPQSVDEVRWVLQLIIRNWRDIGFDRWAVVDKANNRLLGWCGLNYLDDSEEVEIGYGIAREYWGLGLIPEAAQATLRYGFEELHLQKIVAVAFPENLASQRVMQKLGMHYVKTAPFIDGDLVYYAIYRDEFAVDDSPYILTH
jgi:ribosomal-protein-alanine N-acetyltransferase